MMRGVIERQEDGVVARLEHVPETIEAELRAAGWHCEICVPDAAEWWFRLPLTDAADAGQTGEAASSSLRRFMAQFTDEIVAL